MDTGCLRGEEPEARSHIPTDLIFAVYTFVQLEATVGVYDPLEESVCSRKV